MERALLNFFIIIAADITVFSITLYIWALKRKKIIGFIHTGFAGLLMKYYRKQKEGGSKGQVLDNVDQVELRCPYLFSGDGRYREEAKDTELDEARVSDNDTNNSMYIASRDLALDGLVDKADSPRNVNKPRPWWHYLLKVDDRNIRNNEAVLYLRFMRNTCVMLALCSVVSLVSNIVLCIHLALENKPYFIATYMLEDLLKCKFTIWTLYLTIWIYSIIVYVYIINFRSMVNKGKQITVILRPQLHTIMVCGFEKTVTDPKHIYQYFDKYFPEHILAAHLIFNHSKRMILEEELEATKAQISFCRDMSLIIPWRSPEGLSDCRLVSNDSNGREMNTVTIRNGEKGTQGKRRSSSYEILSVKERASRIEARSRVYRRSKSSSHINLLPKTIQAKKETVSENKDPKNSVMRLLKTYKTKWMMSKGDSGRYPELDDRFTKLLKRVKELKVLIDDETKRKHATSARVSFVSFADPNLVLHILMDRTILEEMPTWRIYPAPHPRDIIWKHIHLSRWYILLQMLFYNLLLATFYVAVTWIISNLNLLKTVKSVSKTVEGESETVNINDISQRSLINALMPPIVMAFLNSCVHPFMINTVSRKIGFWNHSTYQKYLLFCHVFCLIISTILIPLLASMLAFWKIFDGAFDSLSLDLGKVLVSTSWRFSTIYVFNATFLGSSNQLLQLSQIAIRSLGIYFFKYDIGMTNFDFGYWYAFHLSILTLVMLFSAFVPYLPMLGTLYFAIRYCVDRHNIVHRVLQLPLDSTGKISESAVKSMLLCISITQFGMSGVFLNCQDVLPPLCITLLYIASVATWLLLYASNADTMVETTEALHKLKLKPLNKLMMETIKMCYMHPCDSKDLIDSRK